MKNLILILIMLVSVKGFTVEKYFYAPSPMSFWNAGSWGGSMPSAGDNLHISGTCIMDVTPGIDYGNLFLDNCGLAGILLFTYENHTLSVNQLIVPAGACAVLNLHEGGFLRIRGSLNIASTSFIVEGAGALEFYSGSVLPNNISTYKNLSIVTDYAYVRLAVPTTVQDKLFLRGTYGILELRSNDLTIGPNGTIVGIDGNHYIEMGGSGKLIRYVDSTNALFPFGYKGSSYVVNHFLTIKNSGTPDWFAVGLNGSFVNTPSPNNCVVAEWSISEGTPGGSNASLTFSWGYYSDLNYYNRNQRTAIARYDSSKWIEKNSSDVNTSVQPYTTTAGGFTSFGYFAVKNKSKIVVNLSVIPEGLYNIGTGKLNKKDTVTTYLREINSPYSIIDSSIKSIDSINYMVRDTFFNALSGNYYLVVRNKNNLETWSKAGGERFGVDSTYTYDFTNAYSQAYGNNLIQKGSKFCIYSGDVNQDGVIDLTDLGLIDNDVPGFVTGNVPTDLNGDYFVDASDLAIADNNLFNFVSVKNPVVGSALESKLNKNTRSGKDSKNLTDVPDKFELKNNYPNPFNPTTNIKYDLPVSGFVSLRIFDITGREIASLVNETKNAGSYSVEWNASQFSSGTYFYKIVSGEFSQVKRMILVK